MKYGQNLVGGRLLKRYNRFLADIQLENGQIITAHCPNSGAMLGVKDPGMSVWLMEIPLEKRKKLSYSWELVESEGVLVGINTQRPNQLVKEALQEKRFPEFSTYDRFRPEVKIDAQNRIDFLLEKDGCPPFFLEVKNVHWKNGQWAVFPDCLTQRGTKHLNTLMSLRDQGYDAGILYVVQRSDCQGVSLAHTLDPAYVEAAKKAHEKGVKVFAYGCRVSREELHLVNPLKYDIYGFKKHQETQ